MSLTVYSAPSATRFCVMCMEKMAWERDDCSFMFVEATVRRRAPFFSVSSVWKENLLIFQLFGCEK